MPAAQHALMLISKQSPTLSYIGNTNDGTDTTTYTFTSANIGTATADRVVLVGVVSGQTPSTAPTCTVTIGGNSATQLITKVANPVNCSFAGFYALNVTSGTTATIVATFSGTQARCAIVVWTLTGTGGSTTMASSSSNSATSGTTVATAVTAQSGGAIAALDAQCVDGTSATISWTNATLDVSSTSEALAPYGAAHKNGTTAGSTTVTATSSNTIVAAALVVAAW